ncbi:gonadotropin-releasing hormone II receptor-like isoform X2 [Heliangelus exortis]|uniref:gonadotropin-releasing hormone II receptor-like isoform X2 n=1 Tax=Heliangelus exortis TaxID=472823 RepID=UPI003A934088
MQKKKKELKELEHPDSAPRRWETHGERQGASSPGIRACVCQQGMGDKQLPTQPTPRDGDTNTSPSSCPQHWLEPRFTPAAKARVAVTAAIFLVSVGSNAAVLGSLLRKRRKSPPVRPLLLSLALADLLVTLVVMPLDAAWNVTVQWYGGDVSCKLLNFLKLFAMYAAAMVLVVISLDRHSAVLRPFSRPRRPNGTLLRAAWAGSLLLASPQLFLFHLHTVPGRNFTQCVTHGSFRAHWEETIYNMFTFTTLFITPLSVMIVCYIRIIWEISKQLKINKGLIRNQKDYISKARMKTLKMTIVIVATFIICWTPYYLLGLWYWFQPTMIQKMPDVVKFLGGSGALDMAGGSSLGVFLALAALDEHLDFIGLKELCLENNS